MTHSFKMALCGFAGILIGASGMNALNAATAMPPAFLFANIQEVKNPEVYRDYQTKVGATQTPYGGHFIVRGAKAVMLDNSAEPKGGIVIVQFPSMKNLRDWWNSPGYTAIKPIREANTVAQIYAVEGLPQ
jgi:uncharacterized protein (DUF1330 family)